jgi:hypothetical protein
VFVLRQHKHQGEISGLADKLRAALLALFNVQFGVILEADTDTLAGPAADRLFSILQIPPRWK